MGTQEEESMEQAAAARRERLRALKAAQELLNAPESADGDDSAPVNTSVKFRNYVPQDKDLQEGKLPPPALPKFEDPVSQPSPPSETKEEDPFRIFAPEKPNSDLRRDVKKKLEKLDKRTQKALFKLMEEQEKQRQLEEKDGTVEDES